MKALADFRPLIEKELQTVFEGTSTPLFGLDQIYLYHLGFADKNGQPVKETKGKYLRPSICMAVCAGFGGSPHSALAPATSLELVHRTTLIFDDIQDKGVERNGQPAVWKIWGSEQAINAGLALSCIARLAIQRMHFDGHPANNILLVHSILERAVIELTRGQYLDLAFMDGRIVTFQNYLEMINQKTGALFGTAAELGAVCARRDTDVQDAARAFGIALGAVFQMQDDYLGVWGDAREVGKTANDLIERKRSLPVVLAMERWPEEMMALLRMDTWPSRDAYIIRSFLENQGIKDKTREVVLNSAYDARQRLTHLNLKEPWAAEIDQLLAFVINRSL